MLGQTRVLLAAVAFMLATPVGAQSPTPTTTAFDGTYAGVSRVVSKYVTGTRASLCPQNGVPAPLTISNGAVQGPYWQGSVSPQGALMMRAVGMLYSGQIDGQGTVRGQINGTACVITITWQKKSR
jgi:hypothetical protein